MNWYSIILASITPLVIASIFYHPKVFGKSSSFYPNAQEDKLRILGLWSLSVIFSVLLSFFLLEFNNGGINQEGDFDNFAHGAWHGAFVTVTIIIPITVTNALLNRANWKTTLINILFWLITLIVMGGILDALNHWENLVLPE